MIFIPSIGLAVTSTSIPLLFVSPLSIFIEVSEFREPSALYSAVCARLLFVIWYIVRLVLKMPLQKSFLIPASYWSMMEGFIGCKSTVVPVFGVNELE